MSDGYTMKSEYFISCGISKSFSMKISRAGFGILKVLPLILLTVQCTKISKADNASSVAGPQNTIQNTSRTQCYLWAENNDTMAVRLTLNDDVISGNISRKPFEKDKAEGTFVGQRTGKNTYTVKTAVKQEGIEDTISLQMKLENKQLHIFGNPVYESVLQMTDCQP